MANFTSADTYWCWGSLKPWQLLHSKLAEGRERRGSMLDVWELVDETLGATTDLRSRDQEGDGVRSHGLQFLGDDGEFWRHGGVMETRIREWMARRDEEEQEVVSAVEKSSKESAVISTSSHAAIAAIAWATGDDQQGYVEEVEKEEEEEEEEEEDCSLNYGERIEEEGANYDDYEENYEVAAVVEGAIVAVVNKCYMARTLAAPAADHDEEPAPAAITANKAAAMPRPDVEEETQLEVCPVCLEKLRMPNQANTQLRLACRHAFHRDCLSPWLQQRQPHACCPCCRAPISAASMAAPPSAAEPLDLAAARPMENRHNSDDHVDIMGLLADVEAALERLGFRS